jgi:hypothetical protein
MFTLEFSVIRPNGSIAATKFEVFPQKVLVQQILMFMSRDLLQGSVAKNLNI